MSGEMSGMREGFICPVCLQDLGDVSQLQKHFAEAHSAEENGDVVVQLKGLFGKAKQRLFNLDVSLTSSPSPEGTRGVQLSDSGEFQPQQEGVRKSHTRYFLEVRDQRVDVFAVETNKLIIRLDKLVNQSPSDPSKRKAFEKNVIPWMEDSSANHCDFCGSRFTLTRRKHHCRLCGKIMCNSCSRFLTFLAARKLTNPAFAAGYDDSESSGNFSNNNTKNASPTKKAEKFLTNTISLLKRDGSDISLGSLLNQEGEDHLRICPKCKDLLERRDQIMEQRTQAPNLVLVYESLSQAVVEAGNIFPSYCRMVESLRDGESMYDLHSAQELKVKVLKLQEKIDIYSKKILMYGKSDSGSQRSPRELLLQKNIRNFATNFLHDMIVAIPELPSESEYVKLQEMCKERVKAKISQERAAADRAASLTSSMNETEYHQRFHERDHSKQSHQGWTPQLALKEPASLNPFTDEEETPIDPLQQQIEIIKGFLSQAVQSGRLDEVKALEANLRELQDEFKKEQFLSPRDPIQS